MLASCSPLSPIFNAFQLLSYSSSTTTSTRSKSYTQETNRKLRSSKLVPFPSFSPWIPTQEGDLTNIFPLFGKPDGDSPQSSTLQNLGDSKTSASLFRSCSNSKEVKQLHALLLRLVDFPPTFVLNNLLSVYLDFRELDYAVKVFDEMPQKNVVSWTAFCNGFLKMGFSDEAKEIFAEMIENNIEPNGFTYTCLFKLCGDQSDFELGRQLHACVVKGNSDNLILESGLLYFYSECRDVESASRVFNTMSRRDVISWTTLIAAYAKHGDGNMAFLMFSVMQRDGFCPSAFTVSSVLKACGAEKDLRLGRQLHGTILKGMVTEDVFVSSSLLAMYSKCGEISDARTLFDKMPNRNTVTWTSMISGYARNGDGEEALALFRRMKRRRISTNDLTVVSVLHACSSIGSPVLGKEVQAQVMKNSGTLSAHMCGNLIWLYSTCGQPRYASRLLECMPTWDVISWTAAISGNARSGRSKDALGFLNGMLEQGVEPNPFTYSSALRACAQMEYVAQGRRIHARVSKSGFLSNVFVGSALMSMYMKCQQSEEACKVFDAMVERNSVSWRTMIVGLAKNGRCREALKLLCRMEAEGFQVDDFVRCTVISACGDFQWMEEEDNELTSSLKMAN